MYRVQADYKRGECFVIAYYNVIKTGLPTLITRGHFHPLPFIYFQTVFLVFSSISDASANFQIETPSCVLVFLIGDV